jgi:hypothetical protein
MFGFVQGLEYRQYMFETDPRRIKTEIIEKPCTTNIPS